MHSSSAIVLLLLQESFNGAKSWVKELQRRGDPGVVIALAGNKCDLASRVVAKDVGVARFLLHAFAVLDMLMHLLRVCVILALAFMWPCGPRPPAPRTLLGPSNYPNIFRNTSFIILSRRKATSTRVRTRSYMWKRLQRRAWASLSCLKPLVRPASDCSDVISVACSRVVGCNNIQFVRLLSICFLHILACVRMR
jgi:hypothetical protein